VFQTRVMDPPRVKAELTNLFRLFAGTLANNSRALANNSRALLGGGVIRALVRVPNGYCTAWGQRPA